jgi:predicted HTH domain antitoxin
MAHPQAKEASLETAKELTAIVRAGCFASEKEAMREAVQVLFAVQPHLRVEAAIRRYLDEEITLARAAELAGLTRWRFQELLAQRGIRIETDAGPIKELDRAVERIGKRRK